MENSTFVNQNLKYWVLAGFTGLLLFVGFKNQFHFFSNAPIYYSKEQIIDKTISLYQDLGIETDTINVLPFRQQRVGLYLSIVDSLKQNTPTPSQLNEENFHLHGWDVVSASTLGINEGFALTASSIFDTGGLYRTKIDNAGQIKSFELNQDKDLQTNIEGVISLETAQKIVEEIFGYNLRDYDAVDISDGESDSADRLTEERGPPLQLLETAGTPATFTWRKFSGAYQEYIEIELSPVFDLQRTGADNLEIQSVSVDRFEAYHDLEKLSVTSTNDYFVVIFISIIALLGLLTFIEGLGQLFKGKADWKRILFIALAVTVGVYGWRLIFMLSFTELLTVEANIVIHFNQLIFGLVMGLFAAIAYIGWEAYARGEKRFQINLVDAFWQGKVYLRETGSAIIKGFSLGGILLGITALFLIIAGLYLYHSDSQYGFTEVINRPQFLSINLSVFIIAALGSLGMVGIVYNFFSKRIQNSMIVMIISILIGGFVFTGMGRTFGTSGSEFQELMMFGLIAIPLFTAYKISGVVTVFAGLWFYSSIINILPYIGSPLWEISITAWLQLLVAGGIVCFGFVAYRKAPSISTISSYIPEYEQKMIRNLRFENEMQIARETQQKLMPLEHLTTNEYELHGYFLPSFEVGGDYFDYVRGKNNGKEHLTLTVVDVSGKSMRAAMQAVFTSGLLRSRMYTDQPSRILREVCPVIFDKTDSRTFITCLISCYDPGTRTLKLANAGHCLPILKRNGKAEFLRAPDPRYPLGIRQNVDYDQLSLKLKPGDLVVFYSDGFPEAVNEKGERIGFDRALAYIEAMESENLSARVICNRIKEFIKEFSVERLADDTTILCLKIK
ncbi:hypothetical protein BH23BAC3_BH23BAC3_14700 [soil metagenome]